MAKPQSAKHTRSNSIVYVDTAAPPPEEISHRVQELNPRSIANILACAARIHPDVMYMRSQAQYDISVLVADEVVDIIESITDHYGQFANPQTRLNGLSTLRKIGKTIALSTNDTLGREVQERFQSDACLVNGMMEIINFMTADEELEELARNECIHPGIEEVLNLLDPARDEYEEEIDEDKDKDDDEDEDEEEEDEDEDDVSGSA
ncbi:hypothetical protein AAEP93_001663 [Penicillium crustosum]